jgi:hypothetical protein
MTYNVVYLKFDFFLYVKQFFMEISILCGRNYTSKKIYQFSLKLAAILQAILDSEKVCKQNCVKIKILKGRN